MELRKDTEYSLPVKRVEFFNGKKCYVVEYDGREYRIRMYPYQKSSREELFCVWTGNSALGTPLFEQSYSAVLNELYEVDKVYPFTIAQECIDQNTGAFYYRLSDEQGLYHRVYMAQNPMYKQGDKVQARVLAINNNYLTLDILPKESSKASFSLGDLIDLKKAIEPTLLDFSKFDPYKDTTLRDYQVDNKKKIYEAWKSCRSVMLQMPTGTGKTRLFVSIARDIFDYGASIKKAFKVLILAHRKELIEQISDHLGNKYRLAHGLIISQNIEQKKYSMQVGSVPTLNRRLERWEDKDFDVIIIDEAHHVKAKSYKKIIDMFPKAKILGVTATPYRLNHAGFRPEFDDLIVSPSVAEFIKRGYLCEYDYYSIRPNSELQKEIDQMKLDFEGDYKESEMMDVMDRDFIRADILDAYQRYAGGKKAIVYTINRSHNVHLAEKFKAAGIVSASIDSETPKEKRDELVGKFRRGEIQVLFNVNIFSEGFDCPDVEVIQLARPTKSLSMYLQQVGRGLRPAEGKERLLILDNVGLYNKFGFPSARRKWRYHFEGQDVDESPSAHRMDRDEEREVKDIFEGNEEVEMLHTSVEEEVQSSALDSIIRDYKENFISYASQKLDQHTIQGYVRSIENMLDGYIREHIKPEFKSLFNTVDLEELSKIGQHLSQDRNYIIYNDAKHHVFSAAFNKYVKFAQWFNEHQSDAPALPDIVPGGDAPEMVVNYKEQFKVFLRKDKYSSFEIELTIIMLESTIDRYIKQLVNPDHRTLFETSDVEQLENWLEILQRDYSFVSLNRIKKTKPVLAMKEYIAFAKTLEPQEQPVLFPVEEKKTNTIDSPKTEFQPLTKEFRKYLKSKGIGLPSIRRYVSALSSDVNPLIRKLIEPSFISIYANDKVDVVRTLYDLLKDEEEFKTINQQKYNALDLAFRKYIDFLEERHPVIKDIIASSSDEEEEEEENSSSKPIADVHDSDPKDEGESTSIAEIDATLQELDNLVALLKKNKLPVNPEVAERQRRLRAKKASMLKTELITGPILENLKESNLDKIVTFKYTGAIRDVDILSPSFSQDMVGEAEDLEKIITLMKKNKIAVPQDVLNRQQVLAKQSELRVSVRQFENWLVGYMSYLKLDDVEIESVYYSPRTGFLVKYVGLDHASPQEKQIVESKPFVLDKAPAPRVKGKAILRVVLENGSVIEKDTATDTFVEAIEHFGIDRVKQLDIQMYHRPMIASKPHPQYKTQCKKLSNGEYLMTLSTTERKMQLINSIASHFGKNIKAQIIDTKK